MIDAAAPPAANRRRITLASLMSLPQGGSAYAAASQFDRSVALWKPPLVSADVEILREARAVRARARDLYRNHPMAKQIVRQAVHAVVGKKLRYASRVDFKFLGIDEEEADRWGREFDRAWDAYAHGPGATIDAGRRLNFSQFMRLALRSRMIDGEALVSAEWDERRRWKTCFQLVDVDRLDNPHGKPDSAYLKGGVLLDQFSAPVGYYVRNGHPADVGVDAAARSLSWSLVPRVTAWDRMVMAHSFLPERAGQTRGISDFTTVIRTMKQEAEFSEADLAAAILNASYALVIKSRSDYKDAMAAIGVEVETDENGAVINNPATELALQQLARYAEYYNEANIRFGPGMIPHLAPDDELQMVTPGNKGSNAPEFAKHAVKRYAAGLGGDPISISQDYSDVNYSSARMSVASNWRGHEITRGDLVYDIGMPMVAAFAEEAVFSGALGLPKGVAPADFFEALPALVKGVFLTGGPPMLDPVKERQGQQMGWALGTDTLEEICAEEGEDWTEKIRQKGREIAAMRAAGVPIPGEPVMPPASAAPADEGGKSGDAKDA
jgi:lambda family phage portal protein